MDTLEKISNWLVAMAMLFFVFAVLDTLFFREAAADDSPETIQAAQEAEYYRVADYNRKKMNGMIYWMDISTNICFVTVSWRGDAKGLAEVECKDDVTYQLFQSEGPPK